MVDQTQDRLLQGETLGRVDIGLVEPIGWIGFRRVAIGRNGCFSSNQIFKIELIYFVENDGSLQLVCQFSNIARPIVCYQVLATKAADRFAVQTMAFGQSLEKQVRQPQDVIAPFAQWCNFDAEQIQSM